ncbi:SMC-Scp complex subunit ScpB [bacterium]|nr:SMC-Scp complex subunit ScpB [bacterium]
MSAPENPIDPQTIRMVIEAVLFAATEPVSAEQLVGLFGANVSEEEIQESLSMLWEHYEKMQSSLQIVKIGGGFKMTTRGQYSSWIEKFFTKRRKVSLSKASLEVLSLIAYHQPTTIAEIDHVRGVDSAGVARGLLKRGMIAVKGRKKTPGRPLLYVTTDKFLDRFGLDGLESLVRPDEIDERAILKGFPAEEDEGGA